MTEVIFLSLKLSDIFLLKLNVLIGYTMSRVVKKGAVTLLKVVKNFWVALSGSFDVHVSNGLQSVVYPLNRSYMGLHIPEKNWRSIENFSTNSLCLVLASTPYDESDYLYEYSDFLSLVK